MNKDIKYGWIRDLTDIRDYDLTHPSVKSFLIAGLGDDRVDLPASYDMGSKYKLPAIKDQGQIGSCTGNAIATMYQTFEIVAGNGDTDYSRLFLYKNTRKILGWSGDSGATLRDTMKSLALFGIPPESFWPYNENKFDVDPTAFEYSIAQNYQALTYYRLDPFGSDPDDVINAVKINLYSNRPCVLGFTVYSSMGESGDVPMPGMFDSVRGGHAIELCGFDDNYKIKNSTGAFKFANSWGTDVGYNGYFWLPYDYMRKGLATDIWTLMSAEYLALGVFNP